MIYTETVLGTSCAPVASDLYRKNHVADLMEKTGNRTSFYKRTRNNHSNPLYYQDIEAFVHFEP